MQKNISLTFIYVGNPLKEYHTFVTPSSYSTTLKNQLLQQINGIIPLGLSIIQEREFVIRHQKTPLLHEICTNLFNTQDYRYYNGWMKFNNESSLYNWTETMHKSGQPLSFVQHENIMYLAQFQQDTISGNNMTDNTVKNKPNKVEPIIEQMMTERTTGFDKVILDWLYEHNILKAYCLKQVNFIIEHHREEYSKEFGSRKFVSEQDIKNITVEMLSEKKHYHSSAVYSMISFHRVARFYGMDDWGNMVNVCLEKESEE